MGLEAECFRENWYNNFVDNLTKIEMQLETPYGWNEFDPLRKEIAQCLLSGLYLAAVTSTNLLVELFLKVILIYQDAPTATSYCNAEVERFKDPVDEYSSNFLYDNVINALKKGLIKEKEKEQIEEWKNKFRNPFSHADVKKIFDRYPSMIGLVGFRLVPQSKKDAFEYFIAVDKLIRDVISRNFKEHPGTGR
ncbi:MAG: hypothetical protein Q8861_08300 [Bacteroidota bacterium]|nr:hypothetical protein [Bacteroidota bacterium]